MAVGFVAEDGDAVHAAAAVEVGLELLGRRAVVDVPHVDRPLVDLLLLLERQRDGRRAGRGAQRHLFVDFRLHLLQLLGLFFHLFDTSLYRLQFWVDYLVN